MRVQGAHQRKPPISDYVSDPLLNRIRVRQVNGDHVVVLGLLLLISLLAGWLGLWRIRNYRQDRVSSGCGGRQAVPGDGRGKNVQCPNTLSGRLREVEPGSNDAGKRNALAASCKETR